MNNTRIKEAREMTGMSLRQAARFSGYRISADEIDALESGKRLPNEDEMVVLAETYEVKLEWLRQEPELKSPRLALNARGLDGLAPNDVAKLVRQLQAHRQV